MEKTVHQDNSVSNVPDRRAGNPDRRQFPRGGRRAGDAARVGVLALICLLGHSLHASAQTPIRFGFDVASAKAARANGVPVSYGSMWAGPWNQRWGWQGIEDQLNTAKANGAQVVDGLEILVAQGAASFERWTGRTAPDEVMREAVADIAV